MRLKKRSCLCSGDSPRRLIVDGLRKSRQYVSAFVCLKRAQRGKSYEKYMTCVLYMRYKVNLLPPFCVCRSDTSKPEGPHISREGMLVQTMTTIRFIR